MNIKAKLLGFGCIGIAIAIAMGCTAAWAISNLAAAMTISANMTVALRNHMDADMMHDALRADVLAASLAAGGGDAAGLREAETDMAEHAKRFREAIEQVEARVPQAQIKQEVAAMKPVLAAYIEAAETIVHAVARDAGAARARLPEFLKSFSALEEPMQKIAEKMESFTQAADDDARRAVTTSYWTLGIGVLLAVLVVIGSSLLITPTITKPLAHAVEVANAIAQGDLSRQVRTGGSDETGRLLSSMQAMQTNLASLLTRLRSSAENVNGVATALSDSSSKLEQSSNQQSDAAASVASAVQEMTVSIGQVAERSRETRDISTQSGELTATGEQLIQSLVQDMASIQTAVMRSAEVIQSLGQQSQHIRDIVRVIKDIADQTNLLALNAAIEAARAGEQGRGFAVVADEVRKLADRTSESTQEISRMIESIDGSLQAAVGATDEGVSLVDQSTGRARDAGSAITRINDGVQRVLGAVRDISSAIQEQSTVSTDIARGVERMAQMCEENRAAASASAKNAHDLDALARSLQDAAAGFKLAAA